MSNSLHSRRRVLQVTGVAVGSSVLIGTASADDHEIPESYSVELTGGAETHEVETNASGVATFEADFEACEIHYTIDVEWLCDATQAHIHYGSEGEDGPVVAQLYPEDGSESKLIEGRFDGTLAEGTLTTDDFEGKFADKGFEAIAQKLAEEGAYVNIHTESYPEGELRGQVVPGEVPPTPDDSEEEEEVDEDEEEAEEEDEEEADEEDEEPSDDGEEEEVDEDEEEEAEEDDEEEEEEAEEDDEPVDIGNALAVVDRNVDAGRDTDNEYIVFENTSDQEIDLGGYEVTDREAGTSISATFPSGFTLSPGEQVRVTSGSGSPTDDEIFMGSGRPVWNQDGDIVVVNDPSGNTVFEYEYGNPSGSLISALAAQVTGLFS